MKTLNKICILFIAILLLSFSGQSNSMKFTGDPPIKLDIDTAVFKGDTLYVEVSGYDDLYFCLPFGKHSTIIDFKKNNKWTTLFKEVKIKDPIYKDDVYCYCDSTTKICVWKGINSYMAYNAIEPVGITNYISSPQIILKHNIHVEMSLLELLTKFGYLQNHQYQSAKVVEFYYIEDELYHFYLFDDEILVKIIFFSPNILFKEEFDCQ